MCNGSIMDKLISFSLPLMVSGILQLAFNAVDIIVVGRFSGSQALAAVGSTTALINVFTNLFIGISLGANVLAARFYAAGKDREMSETVHTSITLALISGIMMAVIGVLLAKWALEIMGTPDDVIGQSALYMRIYFMGMPFFMLYNYGAAILRAIGDTKRPLIFLIISGIANAALNMILVILFHMGVAGVAIGTIISQLISCVLVLTCLYRSEGSYQLRFSKLKINGAYMEQIFQVGVPAGIQSTVINLSNALLQSSVNSFGSIAMAGYTAANNILGFLYMSVNSITQACMSFTSQNYGVGKLKRMDKMLREVHYSGQSIDGEGFMIEDFPDLNCDVEHSVLTKMEQQDIHKVIDQLNTEERMIIYSIFFENKTQTQMAEIMGISRQVLAYKLKTILNKMREMYMNKFF